MFSSFTRGDAAPSNDSFDYLGPTEFVDPWQIFTAPQVIIYSYILMIQYMLIHFTQHTVHVGISWEMAFRSFDTVALSVLAAPATQ